MNDAGLDQFVAVLHTIFLAMVVGPACYFVYYYDRARPRPVDMTPGKWRLWYTLYGTVAILVFLTSAAGA